MNDLIEQFRQGIAAAGLTPPTEIIDDGVIHRFSTNGKPTHKNGWYMLHTDGIAAGAFGDWREGFTQNWCSKADTGFQGLSPVFRQQRLGTNNCYGHGASLSAVCNPPASSMACVARLTDSRTGSQSRRAYTCVAACDLCPSDLPMIGSDAPVMA